jgi:hypothetical protein
MASYLDAKSAIALVQLGGPGNPWQLIPPESEVDAITGGGTTKEYDYAGNRYVGTRVVSNPAPYTTTVRTRSETVTNALRKLAKQGCFGSLAVLDGCPALDITQFSSMRILIDASVDAGELASTGLAVDRMSGANAKQMDTFPISAPGGEGGAYIYPLAHVLDATLNVNANIEDVLAVRAQQCAGDCGPQINIEDQLIAVGGPVSPATIPRIYYRGAKGGAWSSNTLTGITDGVAVSVTKAGDRVLIGVTGTSAGLYAVSYAALQVASGSVAATAVTGVTGAINAVHAVSDNVVYAGGAAGALFVSIDGGYSFTALASGTVQPILSIASRDQNRVYFGGQSGVLLRRVNGGAITNLAPSVITGDNVLTVAVPPRGTEVYIGTNTGEIWRSRDGGTTWAQYQWSGGNVGNIPRIAFTGIRGAVMMFIQNDATPDGRVLVDYSGGAGGVAVKALGTYSSPVNGGFNAIAVADYNYAYVVGDISAGAGFAGEVASA